MVHKPTNIGDIGVMTDARMLSFFFIPGFEFLSSPNAKTLSTTSRKLRDALKAS